MNGPPAFISSIGVALPDFAIGQAEAGALLAAAFRTKLKRQSIAVLEKVFSHPSVQRRYFAITTPEALFAEGPDERAQRFTRAAVDLAEKAARSAMAGAGITEHQVTGIVVNTCTGYLCPGLTSYLIERLNLSPEMPAFDLVGSGCGGALPNLQMARGLLDRQPGGAVLSISVEICSATFQMGNERSLIISNALFGDGAAAVVLRDIPGRLRVGEMTSRWMPRYRDHIRFVYRNGMLHNQLSRELPGLVAGTAQETVQGFLRKNGIAQEEIRHWAVHPGGDHVLSAVRERLGIDDRALEASRRVLARCGNMSSPSVWFIMREHLEKGMETGDPCLMLSFGAGLSMHACLLHAV